MITRIYFIGRIVNTDATESMGKIEKETPIKTILQKLLEALDTLQHLHWSHQPNRLNYMCLSVGSDGKRLILVAI